MGWAYLAVSLAGALLTLNALRPPRRGLVSSLAFLPSWLVSELPVHTVVWQAGATAAFWAGGAFSGPWPALAPALAGLAVTACSSAGLVVLALAGWRAGRFFSEALDAPPGPPIASLLRLAAVFPVRPRPVRRLRDVDYACDGSRFHRLDIFLPPEGTGPPPGERPVLLYFHGGAWMISDKREQGLPMMHHLASLGAVCATANHRLSPRATWPEHLDDCRAALAWVRAHIAEHGGDPARIVLAGASSGGHLAALLALDPGTDASGAPLAPVAGCVGLYGVYDLTAGESGHGRQLARILERFVLKKRRADEPALYEAASPRAHVGAAAPPFLLLHGQNDTLVPVATARSFAAALRGASAAPVVYVELPLTQHAFDVFWSPRSAAAAQAVASFVMERVAPVRG